MLRCSFQRIQITIYAALQSLAKKDYYLCRVVVSSEEIWLPLLRCNLQQREITFYAALQCLAKKDNYICALQSIFKENSLSMLRCRVLRRKITICAALQSLANKDHYLCCVVVSSEGRSLPMLRCSLQQRNITMFVALVSNLVSRVLNYQNSLAKKDQYLSRVVVSGELLPNSCLYTRSCARLKNQQRSDLQLSKTLASFGIMGYQLRVPLKPLDTIVCNVRGFKEVSNLAVNAKVLEITQVPPQSSNVTTARILREFLPYIFIDRSFLSKQMR